MTENIYLYLIANLQSKNMHIGAAEGPKMPSKMWVLYLSAE